MKNYIKDERTLKLKMIKSIQMIKDELNSRKLKYTEEYGVFTVSTKDEEFKFQIDDGENITCCWTDLSEYKSFNLCESDLILEEFLMQLDQIIKDVNKLYRIKAKVEKKINEIEDIISNSDIEMLEINEYFFDDLLFENIISTNNN